MTWEYRLVKRQCLNKLTNEINSWLAIEEVYYDEFNNVVGFGEPGSLIGESFDEIEFLLNDINSALTKPILETGMSK